MPNEQQPDNIDWQLTTWEGSRREQLRRWAALPLEQMIQAIGDMGDFAGSFSLMDKVPTGDPTPGSNVVKAKFDE